MKGEPPITMDGRVDREPVSGKAQLVYPFAGPPERGHTIEVAPGVRWIRMPLPYALNHINLWALDDGEGWALVDTDHVGMAGWLTRKFGVRLWMTPLEYLSCRVIVGTGHSPAHARMYCPALKVLISGDHVLPRISSNVSVYPTEPDADPMRGWLDSLAKIRREVPDDVLVLPAHNECFRGLHARIDALASGQERSLERLRRSLQERKRAVDVFGALFARTIGEADVPLLGMATGESLACLNYQMYRGEMARAFDADGLAWYRGAAPQE